ncbi:MAG: nucleoside monophosphate kinase [Rhabdochlamydiaceae bacterium]|nr:nucleoside monophosphate kinase [Rhabdochlamydiaceae bacterium]
MGTGYILLGSPGSGKGTLGHVMQTKGLKHIASGDILRRHVRKQTELGIAVSALVQEGKQVPDGIITEMILKKLEKCIENHQNFVLDGFPQTEPQFESLRHFLAAHPDCNVRVLCMEIEPETALKRMTGRITCVQCETIYHDSFRPPIAEETCDTCHIPLERRSGDSLEKAQARLVQFDLTTKKVMQIAPNYLTTYSIDANGSFETVQQNLISILSDE